MEAKKIARSDRTVTIHRRISAKLDPTINSANHLFLAAYLLIWALFSIVAATLQWSFQRADVVSHMVIIQVPLVAGGILVAAGVFH